MEAWLPALGGSQSLSVVLTAEGDQCQMCVYYCCNKYAADSFPVDITEQ